MRNEPGILYLVATPLGNLEDITFRALRVLGEVDFIAAEDTRHTLKLLNHFQIKKKMLSYYQHNERERIDLIIQKILEGEKVALVSDAGMPGISDPGNLLVTEAVKQGITVVPVPGASAVITALAASGLDTGSFRFEGFLPRKQTEQMEKLKEIVSFNGTLVFYEAPHRLRETLKNILEVMGDREVVLGREITKLHEEFIRGNLIQIVEKVNVEKPRGEYTIILEGSEKNGKKHQNPLNTDPVELLSGLAKNGGSLREDLKTIAQKTGRSTREIYRLYLENCKKK